MTRLERLRALHDAVEAGRDCPWDGRPDEFRTDLLWKATQGSVDAALALIAATLPGWRLVFAEQKLPLFPDEKEWLIGISEGGAYPTVHESADNLANALLLAALAAHIVEEEEK